jgi:hypothetical protein
MSDSRLRFRLRFLWNDVNKLSEKNGGRIMMGKITERCKLNR